MNIKIQGKGKVKVKLPRA